MSTAPPLPKLSERLDNLFGDARRPSGGNNANPNTSRFSADRKFGTRPRNAGPAPQPRAAQPMDGEQMQAPPSAAPVPQGVAVPALKPQAARRAQPAPSRSRMEDSADDEQFIDDEPRTNAPPRRSAKKQAPTPAKRRTASAAPKVEKDVNDDDEPRVARALPAKSPIKAADDADAEESSADEAPAKPSRASGVLFTAQSPVLSVEATGPRKIMIGKEALFVVKIRNSGAAANNVIVTVNVPANTDVASANASTGTAEAPTAGERVEPLQWKISRLEAKSEETLNLKLVPRKSTPMDLTFNWTYTPEASQTLVEVQEPKLAMTISGPDEVLYGQSKIYKLTVSNPGNGDTENVMVGLMPIGRSSEGAGNHRLGTLKAGENKSIDIELAARQAGAITIKAQAFADGGLRTEAAQQVLVRRANLTVEVEAPKVKYAGTTATYRAKLVNAGNAPAENVQFSAMLPPEAKFISASNNGRLEAQQGKVNWNIGSLQPGVERVLEMQCALSAAGENRTQFVAMADEDLSAAATSSTRVEALADLKLEVRDPQGPIAVGEDTVYEVHIRNRGTKAAGQVEVTVFFSEGLEAASVEGGAHEIAPGQVTFKPLAAVPAGETTVLRIHARAEKAGNHIFRAEVICKSLNTKLAAEEATRFYGDDRAGESATTTSEPESNDPPPEVTPEESPEESPSPTPAAADDDEPPAEEAPSEEPMEPTPATPEAPPSSDSDE